VNSSACSGTTFKKAESLLGVRSGKGTATPTSLRPKRSAASASSRLPPTRWNYSPNIKRGSRLNIYKYLGEAWSETEHVFTSELATVLDQRNVLRAWHKLQDDAAVTRAGLHDLRHMHVSLLVKNGLDVRTIADRVGHTNPAFTMKQYSHAFEEQRRAAAISLTDLLGGKKELAKQPKKKKKKGSGK
jgi:integrase